MNIQDALIRLRDARTNHNDDCLFCALKDTRIDEALAFLDSNHITEATKKVEPESTEFTSACDVIDRLTAENEERKIKSGDLEKDKGNCLGCGAVIDHDYCEHCRENWAS